MLERTCGTAVAVVASAFVYRLNSVNYVNENENDNESGSRFIIYVFVLNVENTIYSSAVDEPSRI